MLADYNVLLMRLEVRIVRACDALCNDHDDVDDEGNKGMSVKAELLDRRAFILRAGNVQLAEAFYCPLVLLLAIGQMDVDSSLLSSSL